MLKPYEDVFSNIPLKLFFNAQECSPPVPRVLHAAVQRSPLALGLLGLLGTAWPGPTPVGVDNSSWGWQSCWQAKCLEKTREKQVLVGGIPTPLKNISRLGWLFPIYGKIENVPNHQPECLAVAKSFHKFQCSWISLGTEKMVEQRYDFYWSLWLRCPPKLPAGHRLARCSRSGLAALPRVTMQMAMANGIPVEPQT